MAEEFKINILLTSASSKVPLYESLFASLSGNYGIIVADSDENCLMSHISANFLKLPYLKNLEIDYLCKLCKLHNIRYIVPTRDGELEYFAKYKEYLKAQKIEVMVSNLEAITNCTDKLKFYDVMFSNNIKAIITSLDINNITSESFVVKERFGSGSRNIGINLNKKDAIKVAGNLSEPIFQPYIVGEEFSVDIYNDRNNEIVGVVVRKRVLVRNGESQITQIVLDEDVKQCAIEAIRALHLWGHSVSQIIKDKAGICHIVEVNARIGGASTISFKAGLKSLKWFIDECNGKKLLRVETLTNLKMMRISKDVFYDTSI